MPYLRKYNAATQHNTHIYIPMIQAGANDFAHSGHWTPVSGDVLIQKDGNIPANATNLLPIYSGCAWAFRFTADEMQAKTISVCIQDSGTKVVEDQFFTIETYQNDSAMFPISITPSGIDANVKSLSNDITAANNLESMYDGTGYTDETAPASRDQVSNIGSGASGAVFITNEADNVDSAIKSVSFVGAETSGTNASVNGQDGTYHQIDDSSNAIDIVYQFDIGGGRSGSSIQFVGRLNSGNDEINIQAYNGSGWDTIRVLTGKSGSTDDEFTIPLFSTHTGTGSDLGKVFIRFVTSGQSTPTLYIDQLLVAAVSIGQTVGYANGAVWVDTVNGTAGTESFVNGTADNPVSTWADAQTIASNVGLNRFRIISGSTITLDAAITSKELEGDQWTLDLSGETITNAYISGATISASTGVGSGAIFTKCIFDNDVTIPDCIVRDSYFGDFTWTLAAGNYFFNGCIDRATGLTAPILDFGAAVGNTIVNLHDYSGGVEFYNIGDNGTDSAVVSGNGRLVINSNSSGGTVTVLGIFDIENNSSGTTITQKAALNRANLVGYAEGAVWLDGNASNTDTQDYTDGTADNPVSTLAAAKTIADSIGLKKINMLPGTSVTLDADYNNYEFNGTGYSINLNNKSLNNARFFNGTVEGSGYGTGRIVMTSCFISGPLYMDAVTNFLGCNLSSDNIVLEKEGTYTFDRCFSGVAGTETPAIDVTASGVTKSINLRHYSGGVELKNFGAFNTHRGSIEGDGQVKLNANCGPSGILAIRGNFTITDNANGQVELSTAIPTINQVQLGKAQGGTDNTIILSANASAINGTYAPGRIQIISGSGVGQTREILDYNGTTKVATVGKDWRQNPHTNSSYVVWSTGGQNHVNEGMAQGGGDNTITLNSAASSTSNIYNGQTVFIKGGTGQDQSRIIIAYNGGTKVATVHRDWETNPDSTSSYVMLPLPGIGDRINQTYNELISSPEPTIVPAASSTLEEKIAWMYALSRQKIEQYDSHQLAYADDGSTVIGSGDYTGTNPLTRSKWS